MRIDFSQSLTALDGSPLELVTMACRECGRPREARPAILADLCSDALVQGYRDPEGRPIEVPGLEAVRRLELARRIFSRGVIELTPEDAALIRELVVIRFTTLYSAQIWMMLDPQTEEPGRSTDERR